MFNKLYEKMSAKTRELETTITEKKVEKKPSLKEQAKLRRDALEKKNLIPKDPEAPIKEKKNVQELAEQAIVVRKLLAQETRTVEEQKFVDMVEAIELSEAERTEIKEAMDMILRIPVKEEEKDDKKKKKEDEKDDK